jgi:hypothetical protein
MTGKTLFLATWLAAAALVPAAARAAGQAPALTIGYTAANHGETDPCG